MISSQSLWLGPVHSEARAAFQRAREAGMSPLRSLVIGSVASFKECWAFRRRLAAKVGCSVRTVQRALTEARAEGLIGCARAKPNEIPPKWEHGPVTCGWSHRWVIGWGQAGQAVKQAVDAARARWLVKHAAPSRVPAASQYPIAGTPEPTSPGRVMPRAQYQRRTWTAEELDAELERLQRPPD